MTSLRGRGGGILSTRVAPEVYMSIFNLKSYNGLTTQTILSITTERSRMDGVHVTSQNV